MADPASPNRTHAGHPRRRSSPRRKSCTHCLCKPLFMLCILFVIPLFPSKAPDFIDQPILIKFWELLYLLVVGVALCYGIFSRRNVKVEPGNHHSTDDADPYVGNRFEYGEKKVIQSCDSEHVRTDSDLGMKRMRLGSAFGNPNLRVSDSFCMSQCSNGSSSGGLGSSENKNLVGELGLQNADHQQYMESNFFPVPGPWNSRFESGRMEMGEEGGVFRNPRPEPINYFGSTYGSSENNFSAELGFQNAVQNCMVSNPLPVPVHWNLRSAIQTTEKGEELGVFRDPNSIISDCWGAPNGSWPVTDLEDSSVHRNFVPELDLQNSDPKLMVLPVHPNSGFFSNPRPMSLHCWGTPEFSNVSGSMPQLEDSYENGKPVGELGLQNVNQKFTEPNVSPFSSHSNLRSDDAERMQMADVGVYPNPGFGISDCLVDPRSNNCPGFTSGLDIPSDDKNLVGELGFENLDKKNVELHLPVHWNLKSNTVLSSPSKCESFLSMEFPSDPPESQPVRFLGSSSATFSSGQEGGVEFQELEDSNSCKLPKLLKSEANSADESDFGLLESQSEMSSSRQVESETEKISPYALVKFEPENALVKFEPENSKIDDLCEMKGSQLSSSLAALEQPNWTTELEGEKTSPVASDLPHSRTEQKMACISEKGDLLLLGNGEEEPGDAKPIKKTGAPVKASLKGKSVRRIRKQSLDDTVVIQENGHKPQEIKVKEKPKQMDSKYRYQGRRKHGSFGSVEDMGGAEGEMSEIDKKAGEFIAKFKDQMRSEKARSDEVDKKAGEFITNFRERIKLEKVSKQPH